MKSPRSGKKLSSHELARFLALLAETGNFALACERLGRAKSGLYKRRVKDAAFDAECVAALAIFRLSARAQGSVCVSERELVSKRGRKPADGSQSEPDRRHGIHSRDGSYDLLTLTTYAGRPQLRRAMPGTMTRPDLNSFLQTLAASGNVRFAAASVGVKPSSIYRRRRRDPAFARDMDVAIDTAVAALEMRVIEASGAFLDDEADPGGAVGTLTASEALHFLTLHQRSSRRGGRGEGRG